MDKRNNDQQKKSDASLPKTVQQYIDQRPTWPGGERIKTNSITSTQWFIWWLACAGKFFEGALVFMSGLALPLVVMTYSVSAYEKGFYTAAVLIGIFIGALFLGGLADHFGRKRMFVVEMLVLLVFLLAAIFSVNYIMLLISLVGVGVALGCDYPTAHLIIAESVPTRMRGRLILGAFGFQAIGAFFGVLIAYCVLLLYPKPDAWRIFYSVLLIPVIVITLSRLYIPESSMWLSQQNKLKEAKHNLKHLLKRQRFLYIRCNPIKKKGHDRLAAIFKQKSRRATILTSVPWFLQDLATYGIGIFTPVILLSVFGFSTTQLSYNVSSVMHADRVSARYTMILDFMLILGIMAAISLVDKVGRIGLQIIGFIGCALGLLVVALAFHFDQAALSGILLGFVIFNFMTNLGPNTQTYLLSGECFPTRLRARGAGFAASVGKIGAILTAFFFPVLQRKLGVTCILEILVVASLLGALVTWCFRINTRDLNLEQI